MKTIKKRLLSAIFYSVFGVCFAFAQTGTVKHTVERGETLESIASHYSTTEAKIIELNPDAAQFLYVGMNLNVPDANTRKEQEEQSGKKEEHADVAVVANQNSKEALSPTAVNTYKASDFTLYGISYFSTFDNAGKGYYMFGGDVYSDSGWGGNLHFGFNYGLVDSDYAGGVFLIGPSYGHVYKNVLVSASFDFMGAYSSNGKSVKYGTNNKGEEISYLGTDDKFNWGFALMPKAAIKLGKLTPWLGVNALWIKGADKIQFGFHVGIGFDL